MNWIEEARRMFAAGRPAHFTNFTHCDECAEHDRTLTAASIDDIGLNQLGNPGWDPMCFCSDEGKRYFMPALIRLSLETVRNEFYLGQFLFHLEGDGERNSLFASCTNEQRKLIAAFIAYMISQYPEDIDNNGCADEALRVYRIWSME